MSQIKSHARNANLLCAAQTRSKLFGCFDSQAEALDERDKHLMCISKMLYVSASLCDMSHGGKSDKLSAGMQVPTSVFMAWGALAHLHGFLFDLYLGIYAL